MSDNLFVEIIGKRNEYYTKIFDCILAKNNGRQRVLQSGLLAHASINWAAFFASLLGPFPFFFYYRKMYKVASLLNAISVLIVALSLAKQTFIGIYIYDGAFTLFSLLFSNAVYLSCVNKKLQKIVAIPNENRQQVAKRLGGVTYSVPIVVFFISTPCSIILLVIFEFCKMHL